MRIDTEYHFKIKDELEELKSLVKEFFKEIEYVPFRAVDCNQEKVYELIEKLEKALAKRNDR